MKDGTFTLVCATCKVAADDKTDGTIVCPKCGSTGSSHDVERAKTAWTEQASRDVAKDFQGMMRKTFRGNKTIKYKPGRLPRRPSTAALRFVFVPKSTARHFDP